MITSKLMGGLGNMMFQIAAIHSLANDNNTTCSFMHQKSKNQGNCSLTYVDNIFKNINFSLEKLSNFKHKYSEEEFEYRKLPFFNNTIYEGYFQSEKFFENNKDKIFSLFNIKKHKNDENKIAIHVRRGDYIKFSNVHTDLFNTEYYKSSINYFGKNKNYIVFSDDIAWCKKNFKYLNVEVEFSNNKYDYEDMSMFACFPNKILANSSFSWWSDYLSENKEKTIAPRQWFTGIEGPKQWNSIYLSNWEIK